MAAVATAANAPPALLKSLTIATSNAHAAIDRYAATLVAELPTMQINASVGEASWLWILHHVAITNTTASAVSNLGRTDAVRASGQLAIERQRNDLAGEPVLPLARDLEAQRVATTAAQEEVKAFLRSQRLVTIPEWLPNYTVTGIPAWLAPFDYSQLGEEDDFTSPNRSLDGADFVRCVFFVCHDRVLSSSLTMSTAPNPSTPCTFACEAILECSSVARHA